jgi:NAD(P)H-hydrate epimerase
LQTRATGRQYNRDMSEAEPLVRLTRAQVREIDRRAIEEYHIPGIVLMENAARGVAERILEATEGMKSDPVFIFCGSGNNGGDGLAIARHIHNRGQRIEVVLAVDPAEYRGDAATNWKIIEHMRIPARDTAPEYGGPEVPVYVDALFGTGLTRLPTGRAAGFIDVMNREPRAYVIAVDLPSGLDCDSGVAHAPCVRATETVTFVAEKVGFANPASRRYTGEIIVADIGCPRELIDIVRREVR